MTGRDNAGQRVLNARRVLCGAENSLENTFGGTLPDGAQCFIIEAQANYRYVEHCVLPDDGEYVVMPRGDKKGRWMRAEGLVGFALLEGGKLDEDGYFKGYTYQKLVQFEMVKEHLVYVGSLPRLAHVSAFAPGSSVSVMLPQGVPREIATAAIGCSVSGAVILHPGQWIGLMRNTLQGDGGVGPANLQVILA